MEKKVLDAFNALQPTQSNVGAFKVELVSINKAKKVVTVKCNDMVGYHSIDSIALKNMKSAVLTTVGDKCKDYDVTIYAGKHNLDDFLTVSYEQVNAPTEENRFITPVEGVEAPSGLDGNNIAMWQGHGWYF